MSRYATEGSGRYDRLHGDEDEIAASRAGRHEHVSGCPECGSTDGCLCGRQAFQGAASHIESASSCSKCGSMRKKGHPCSLCGADPCESPVACRAQAAREADDEPAPSDPMEIDDEEQT